MRAAWYETFGAAADVLRTGQRDAPVAGPGEVLVRIATSGVNPSDVKKRAGAFPGLLDDGYVIPNSDGAGTIEAVGGGVDPSRVGQRVWLYQAQHNRRFGTAAEYVAVDARRAVPLPDEVAFDIGAGLGIPAMTAHRCVFGDGGVGGKTILVTGGAGRVGFYAVQWAARAGATVIATAGKDEDRATCTDAGAAFVVSHRGEDVVDAILAATGGQPVDRVVDVDFGANLEVSLEVLRTGGTIAAYASGSKPEPKLPFYRLMYKDLTVHTVIVYDMPEAAKAQAVADISEVLGERSFKHRVAARMPLESVADANDLVGTGGIRGAVVLEVS